MNLTELCQLLGLAGLHVAESEAAIARHRSLLKKRENEGADTLDARRELKGLEDNHRRLVERRDRIAAEVAEALD